MKRAFEIIWEDDNYLVINKKAGVLSIPDRYHDDKVNLFSLLLNYRKVIYPLHRLDKDTSGIMIYAKNEDAHKRMSHLFEERKIYKEYSAILTRTPFEEKGNIETNLAASLQKKDQIVVSKKGKLAITEYQVIESFQDFSLCKIVIRTGRQHQIRVHMAHLGHPLAIDKKYGIKTEIYAQELKPKKFNPNRRGESKPLMNRHSLHAIKIGFKHPFTNEQMMFDAPYPKDFKALLNQLRKWNNK